MRVKWRSHATNYTDTDTVQAKSSITKFGLKMIVEGGAGVGVGVSVVPLLQERFRQLHRMKQLREEKELLRMLYTTTTTSHHDDQHQVMMMMMMFVQPQPQPPPPPPPPPKPHCQLSLSLWPAADCRGNLCRSEAPSNISKSWFADQNYSASDVDTSLHL